MIYFDHASTTYVNQNWIDDIAYILKNMWGNPSNIYEFGQTSHRIIQEAREKIANSLEVEPDEIYFTSGASEGNAWALIQRGKCVCSQYEHHDITKNPIAVVAGEDYLDGILKTKDYLTKIVRYDNFTYSHMYVNNITGEIFDVGKMCSKSHEVKMLFHSDMTQALGNAPIDLRGWNIDMATFSGHKIHTPKFVGFNYFNKKAFPNNKPIKPLIYGGGQESNLRAGTENVPYIHVLGEAVESAVKNMEFKQEYTKELKRLLIDKLSQTDVPFIIASPGNSINSTVAICFKDIESEVLSMMLSDDGIFIGTGSACTNGEKENDSTLEAMGIPKDYIRGLLRFSFDITNNALEIDYVVNKIAEHYKELMV